jgi:hypothetical protein
MPPHHSQAISRADNLERRGCRRNAWPRAAEHLEVDGGTVDRDDQQRGRHGSGHAEAEDEHEPAAPHAESR